MISSNVSFLEGKRLAFASNREFTSSREGLERAMGEDVILEGIATVCRGDMSLEVDLCGIKGIIPKDESAYYASGGNIKDIAVITRVGKAVCFKVIDVYTNENGKTEALLSRRAAQLECLKSYLFDLIPGDIIPARITHMEHFGAFADVGCGIVSLMPIDAISVSRISHPRDRFTLGQTVNAVVRSVDYENGRLYLTHRELLGTWEENAAHFSSGQTVSGIVRSIEDYGIFVELAPNLAGLAEYSDSVKVGDHVSVYIKSMIPEKMKIKLVLIDTYTDAVPEQNLKYYVNNAEHISIWRYSPPGSGRVIESVF